MRKWRVYWRLAKLQQNSWKIKIQLVDQVLDAPSELDVFIMNFKSVALFKYEMVIKAKRQAPDNFTISTEILIQPLLRPK